MSTYKGYTITANKIFYDLDVDEDGNVQNTDDIEPDIEFRIEDREGNIIDIATTYHSAKKTIDEVTP